MKLNSQLPQNAQLKNWFTSFSNRTSNTLSSKKIVSTRKKFNKQKTGSLCQATVRMQ